MLEQLCTKVTFWFTRKGFLEEDLAEWCVYWLQKRILTTVVILVMFLTGGMTFGIDITFCFLLGLLPLRRRLVGFHAESPCSCMLLSVGIVLLSLLLHSTFNEMFSLFFGIVNLIICSILVIFVLKDMPDSKLGLIDAEICKNHKLAIRLLVLESTVGATISILLSSADCWSACQMGIAVVVASSLYNKWREINMKNAKEKAKKLLSVQLKKSVLGQKNEWPATSTPIFFQPVRPSAQKELVSGHLE